MTKLPTLTARDVIIKLKKAGFLFDRHVFVDNDFELR